MLGGVGPDLRPIQGDMSQLNQPRLTAQLQHLDEQLSQRSQVTLPKVADGTEVRLLHCGHRHEVQALLARPGDPPRRVDPLGVGVQQKGRHHRRVIRRGPPLLPVALHNPLQVQRFPHRVPDEVRHMAGRNQILNRRWQQPHLLHIPTPKSLAHGGISPPSKAAVHAEGGITRTGS